MHVCVSCTVLLVGFVVNQLLRKPLEAKNLSTDPRLCTVDSLYLEFKKNLLAKRDTKIILMTLFNRKY